MRVVFETGELAGVGAVTVTAELTLYADGTLIGDGVLFVADTELAVAATGQHESAAPPRLAAVPYPNG